jgi:hypothetical protein
MALNGEAHCPPKNRMRGEVSSMLEQGSLVTEPTTARTAGQETRTLFSMETFKPIMKADVGNEACACICACGCI